MGMRDHAEPADGETMVFHTILIVAADVWRTARVPGTYYVRVFRSSTYALPVILAADTGNHPDVSVVNRIDEVCAVLAEILMDLPGVATARLDAVGRWVTVMPAGLFGPSIGETFTRVTFESGQPRGAYLRHSEVEELVGDRVRPLTATDCAPAALTARGVPTARVSRH
jgi:hypothetical protein